MPVILKQQDFDRWLEAENQIVEALQKPLAPFEPKLMDAFPVSTAVNSPKNQGKYFCGPTNG
jgi:putative SOS response-associated peptidase YedK